MSSIQDTSKLQIQSNTSQISSKKKKRTKLLDIDQYTRPLHLNKPEFESGRKIQYCGQLEYEDYYSIVTNFRKHLQNNHNISTTPADSSIQLIRLKQLQDLLISTNSYTKEDLQATIFSSYLQKDICRKALIRLIISGRLPLSIIE
jgi:spore germination protein YaaH